MVNLEYHYCNIILTLHNTPEHQHNCTKRQYFYKFTDIFFCQTDVSSFFPISSTVITNITTAQPIITTPVPVRIPKEGGNLAYFVGVPVGIIGIIILLLITVSFTKNNTH